MPRVHIDHVSMCVWDLDAAIADWTDILQRALARARDAADARWRRRATACRWCGRRSRTRTPRACSIQLWAPGAPDTWVHKVLAKRGEFVHHIAFLSDDFGHTVEQCREAGLPVLLDENSGPDTMPWLAWNFIGEEKAHGVLIELATRYQAIGDKWYPHPGNAENAELRDELTKRYY